MDEALILELARVAGIEEQYSPIGDDWFAAEKAQLLRFASLVAAEEREAYAALAEDMVLYTGLDVAQAIRARS